MGTFSWVQVTIGIGYKMKSTLAIALLLAACQVQAEDDGETGKVLSFFNVVKFPNALCTGSGSRNGTCYTAEECEDRSGTASGSCADGFGVCCVITLDCGGSSSENNTYFVKASFTTATVSSCPFTICPASSSVCRVRLDFTTFTLASENQVAASATVDSSIGDCTSDTFAAPGAPVICGGNSGQHMYLDSDGSTCLKNVFTFDGDSTTRAMDIMITQYDCKSMLGGPPGCLQYFTGTTGTVSSFNYDSTSTTKRHLSNQDYEMCFRRESGYCSICYIATAFGLSLSLSDTAAQGAIVSNCQLDYLQIPDGMTQANAKLTTQGTTASNRFCGRFMATTSAATANASVCSSNRPFRMAFRTTSGETITATTANKGTENELSLTPYGTLGFSVVWTQQSC